MKRSARRPFGWDLPPGVTDRMIDEAIEHEEDIDMDTIDRISAQIVDLHRDLVMLHDTLGSILVVLRAQAEHLVSIDAKLRRIEERADL